MHGEQADQYADHAEQENDAPTWSAQSWHTQAIADHDTSCVFYRMPDQGSASG
ncbi:hypothetical protein N136_00394 [Leifsonia aquatica ATCC 14665]|uniref:Uncharacterized protein n=1 Tax=Leifsonia aquatica ATCC 14665 TaxID=1358026 RepID=U2TET0_LEIAQ|nr:hypothetical protein N136_00394 [Leifsonia aquatica ATCC 14665]